ncbi:MAG: histidine kinase [Bacteroidota bacterium]
MPSSSRSRRFWLPAAYTALALGWSALWLAATGQGFGMATLLNQVVPEVIFWNAWAAVTPVVFWLARQFAFPVQPLSWKWSLHLLLAALVTVAVYLLSFGLHSLYHVAVTALGGSLALTLGEQFSQRMVGMLSFGLPLGGFVYALLVALTLTGDYVRRLRAEERHSAALEAQLAQAELQALKMQLHPHFLFNALNTISATLQTHPPTADRMLAELGDFLRLTLEHVHRATVPLAEEVDFVRRYLQIEQHRLEDGLAVEIDVSDDVQEAAVPYLILQPLVENALRHGIGRRVEPGRVTVRAEREGDDTVLCVINTGPPLDPTPSLGDGAPPRGIGLANTRARLQQSYGEAASLHLADTTEGVQACVRLPFALCAADHPALEPDSETADA